MQAQAASRLVLTWQQSQLSINPDERIIIGRSIGADINVDREYVSREHLHIYLKDHYFVMRDLSTNGTYVQTEDSSVDLCKRAETRLWGQGWLSLGERLAEGTALHFRHVRV